MSDRKREHVRITNATKTTTAVTLSEAQQRFLRQLNEEHLAKAQVLQQAQTEEQLAGQRVVNYIACLREDYNTPEEKYLLSDIDQGFVPIET